MKARRGVRAAVKGGVLACGMLVLAQGVARGFDEFAVGARPAALGGAFTAVADDVHSLYYNPAGLAALYRPEVTAYYARLFPNLSDQTRTAQTFVAGGLPLPSDGSWGGVGMSYHEFRVDSLFKERTTTLGYGRAFLRDRLALGLGLKMLNRSFGSTADTLDAFSGLNPGNRTGEPDPVFQKGHSASALGVDLGALYAVLPELRVGMALLNANRPDLGLVSDDRLPLVTRLGMTYEKELLRMTADLVRRRFLTSDTDTRLHVGAERQWAFKRYGLVTARGGGAIGGRDFRQINLGAGYELNGIGLDYVFTMPLGAADDTGNLHNLSLSYKFGRAPVEDELQAMVLEEREATARAEVALRAAEAEAAFIREERNQLLTQYATDLERLNAELQATQNSTIKAAPPRVVSPREREQSARDKALREYTAAYEAAMRGYAAQVAQGEGLSKRIELLNVIVGKYAGTGVDLSRATRELDQVKAELAQVSTDYRITLDFYKKTVAQGADGAERVSLLERMIKKYSRSGIDLSEVEGELEKLKK